MDRYGVRWKKVTIYVLQKTMSTISEFDGGKKLGFVNGKVVQ
jgi:hypothetical protein